MNVQQAVSFLLDKAMKAGATAAESSGICSRSIAASCRMGKTESLEYAETSGADLRVFIGKRQAVVSSCVLDEKTLENLATTAVEMAKATPPDEFCGLADKESRATQFPDLDLCDNFEPNAQQLKELALEAEQAALENKKIVNSDGAQADYAYSDILTRSSTGFSYARKKTNFSLSVCVVAQSENDAKERDYDYTSATHFGDMTNARTIGKNAAERTVKRLNAKKIPSANLPVILDKRIARRFFGYFLSAVNGSAAAKKTTFLAGKMHQSVFHPSVNLIENPFVKRGLASRPCDAEGLPCIQRNLIDKGVLTCWLTDLNAARRLNIPPTGHAVRSFGGMPHAAPSNIFVSGGDKTPAELIKSIHKGILITDVFGNGVNLVTGDYSQGAFGYLIENGEIATPVHEITIAGNLTDLFARTVLGNDNTTGFAVNAPTVLIENISVSGK